MKIGYAGLNLTPGKVKFNDEILNELDRKFTPKKFTPYFFEFTDANLDKCDAIAVLKDKMLDVLIPDIEKLETRIGRSTDSKELALYKKCLAQLENEKPICDMTFDAEELKLVRELAPLSMIPVYSCPTADPEVNQLIKDVMDKAKMMFFYTGGKQEVHSWMVPKGADIVTCAGKIHTDLAKGFIKAEVTNIVDFRKVFNLSEAKEKGFTKIVDRDYIIQDGDIIEIRHNM